MKPDHIKLFIIKSYKSSPANFVPEPISYSLELRNSRPLRQNFFCKSRNSTSQKLHPKNNIDNSKRNYRYQHRSLSENINQIQLDDGNEFSDHLFKYKNVKKLTKPKLNHFNIVKEQVKSDSAFSPTASLSYTFDDSCKKYAENFRIQQSQYQGRYLKIYSCSNTLIQENLTKKNSRPNQKNHTYLKLRTKALNISKINNEKDKVENIKPWEQIESPLTKLQIIDYTTRMKTSNKFMKQ